MKKLLLCILCLAFTSLFSQIQKMPDDYYEKVEKQNKINKDSSCKLAGMGDYYYMISNYSLAIKNYELAIALHEVQSITYYRKAQAEYSIGETRKSIVTFTECVESIKNIKDKNAFWETGEDCMWVKSEEFGNYFSTSLGGADFANKYRDVYLWRAQSEMVSEDYYGSIDDIKTYHKISKDSTSSSNYIMGISLLKTTRYAKAEKYLLMALKLNTDNNTLKGKIYYYLAFCLGNQNRLEEACLYWSKATQYGHEDSQNQIKEYCK